MTTIKIIDTVQAWDERKLGSEAECVGVAATSHEEALQDALELGAVKRFVPPNAKRLDDDV